MNIHALAHSETTPVALDVRGLSIAVSLRREASPVAEIVADRLRSQGLVPDARLAACLGLVSWLDSWDLLGDDGDPVPLDAEALYGLLIPTPAYEEMLAAVHGRRAEVNPPDDAVFAIAARVAYRNVSGEDPVTVDGMGSHARCLLEDIIRDALVDSGQIAAPSLL